MGHVDREERVHLGDHDILANLPRTDRYGQNAWPVTKTDIMIRDMVNTEKPVTIYRKVQSALLPLIVLGVILAMVALLFLYNRTPRSPDPIPEEPCRPDCRVYLDGRGLELLQEANTSIEAYLSDKKRHEKIPGLENNTVAVIKYYSQNSLAYSRPPAGANQTYVNFTNTEFFIIDEEHAVISYMDSHFQESSGKAMLTFHNCNCLVKSLKQIWRHFTDRFEGPEDQAKMMQAVSGLDYQLQAAINNHSDKVLLSLWPESIAPLNTPDENRTLKELIMKSTRRMSVILTAYTLASGTSYWSWLDEAMRTALFENPDMKVNILIQPDNVTQEDTYNNLRSLRAFSPHSVNLGLLNKEDGPFLPMVLTEDTYLIGSPYWSGDYFNTSSNARSLSLIGSSVDNSTSALHESLLAYFKERWNRRAKLPPTEINNA